MTNRTLTDTEMMNFLDSLSGGYTGKIILRMSTSGRGWRLHETSHLGAVSGVRNAIQQYYNQRSK